MKLRKSRKLVSVLLIAIAFSVLSGISTFAATNKVQNYTKRYIIKFKTKNVNASQLLSKYSGGFRHQFKHLNAALADMTTQSYSNLKKDPNVDYIEEDNIVKISSSSLTNWGVDDIKAPASWQSGFTGKGTKIAIIDTGSGPHPDLIVTGGTNVISGSNTTSYTDDNGHGTHVAGIIAAQGLNGGVEGVAPGASIYAVKALDNSGSGYTSDIISGIDWAIENKMDIITMSLGSSQSDISLQQAVDTAYNDGILIVAAAGNDGNAAGIGANVEYPANYPSVIAVGAVDSTNTRAYFSSSGSKLEVSAPGVNITSTYLNGGYVKMTGTSMATPFVAGDLALLKQEYPGDTNVQLRQLLDNNVVDLGVKGRDPLYGYGLIVASGNATSTPVTTPITPPVVSPQPVVIPVPTANIPAGSYKTSLIIQLSDKYSKPLMAFYTLDGSTPTTKSIPYKGYIKITSSSTLKAIAVDFRGNISAVLSNAYNIIKPPANPVLSEKGGVYKTVQTITLSSNTPGVSIYYTTDGRIPTAKSTLYTGPITIKNSTFLAAVAIDSSGNSSYTTTALYIILGKYSHK